MSYSIGTTYEGKNFNYLESILPHVQHIEVSPDSLSYKINNETVIHPEWMQQLEWMQRNSYASLLVHGVSLSIGSYDGYSKQYMKLLEELFGHLEIKWHSEHLSYTTVNGEPLGTMLTLPRTDEVIDMVCRRVDEIQKKFKVPFLLENVISMLPPPDSQYSDAAFLNRITELSGCGLILDIYNLQCDEYNFGINVAEFLHELDLDNVYELHLAGGVKDHEYDFMMDIHACLVADSTIELASKVIARKPKKLGAITYEILEEFIEQTGTVNIISEIKKLDQIFNHEPSVITI